VRVPTDEDWDDDRRDEEIDLDRRWARKHWTGKTRAEALDYLFSIDIVSGIEDLRRMPPVPFRYYLSALLDYLRTERIHSESRLRFEKSSAAASFLTLIDERLQKWPEDLAPVIEEVLAAVEFVGARQSLFDAPAAIYGSFEEQAKSIRQRAQRLCAR
jgi:hypothetical protein